ncbi:ankyrin-2-like isoform X2 [Penaeus japonicus]|uniref:ankyrin-2-like isoform X2 n=1 Tax=Penaeus japonicus TaxID=27405 RepID=UPI001C712131|nr:ankyrin-2-like isoform X2 [Penaeus japonicus]
MDATLRVQICDILVRGDAEGLRQKIQEGDIDALCAKGNNKGLRAVHYAAIGGHVETLKILQRNRFDMKAVTKQGLTALHYAVRYSHLDAVKWLVAEAGLDVSLRDNKNNSALDLARRENKEQIREYLEKGAQGRGSWPWFFGHRGTLPRYAPEGTAKDLQRQIAKEAQQTLLTRTSTLPKKNAYEMGRGGEVAKEVNAEAAQGRGGWPWFFGHRGTLPRYAPEGTAKDLQAQIPLGAEEKGHSLRRGRRAPSWRTETKDEATENLNAKRLAKGAPSRPLVPPAALQRNAAKEEQGKGATKELDPQAVVANALASGDFSNLIELMERKVDVDTLIFERNDQGMRAVHYAAQNGNIEMLKTLKDKSFDLKALTRKGFTALHCAVLTGQLDAVQWLVSEAGLDVASPSKGGETALDLARILKRTEIANYLSKITRRPVGTLRTFLRRIIQEEEREAAKDLNAQVDLRREEVGNAQNCVNKALTTGDFRSLMELLKEGVEVDSLIYKSNDQGMRAVHYAAQNGNIEMLKTLKDKSIDLKALTRKGFTALHCAVLTGQLDAVQWLVSEAGLDVASPSKGGETALDLARILKRTEIANYLSKLIEKQAREAAQAGDVDKMKAIVQRGFNVDTEFLENATKGWRLLHFAAERGHTALVIFLIENKAAVNASSREGMTPLHLASWGGHTEVIKALLSKGASGNAKTTAGMTAIHLASMGGHVASLEELASSCSLGSSNRDGKSALHLAAEYGNLDAVRWLVLRGLDVSLRDHSGWTCLQYAKDEGHKKVVEFLEESLKQQPALRLVQV